MTERVATLADLTIDPLNARRHNERNLAAISTSIQETGFGRSMLAASDGTLIAGNATAEALADLDMHDVIVVRSDGTKPIVHIRDDIAPGSDMARKAGLYDNRSAELADGYDPEILVALMEDLDIAPVLMTEAEAAALITLAQPWDGETDDPAEHWQGMPEYEQDDLKPVKQLIVSFAREADVEAFARLVEQTVTMTTKSLWYPAVHRRESNVAYIEDDNES